MYWKEEAKLSCTGGHFMRNYLWGNTIILLLILFSDITLVQSSMAGTIMDTAARRLLRPFLYLRYVIISSSTPPTTSGGPCYLITSFLISLHRCLLEISEIGRSSIINHAI